MSIFEKWKQGLQWSKIQDGIGEPPWEYDFLYHLPESEYPKYLKKVFKYRTGQNVDLTPLNGENCRGGGFFRHLFHKKCNLKTFNQKIQWLKLYGVTPLMRDCTNKVKVRDYVSEIIGEEYLKPVLQVCNSFEKIDFDKLPDSFVIKCNHGSKWQYIVNDKDELISNKRLFDIVKRNMSGWLEQEFWCWNGFEMQYKGIEPKIIVEPLLKDDVNSFSQEINVFCFNGKPKYIVKMYNPKQVSTYDENLDITEDVFSTDEKNLPVKADEIIKQTYVLSKRLSEEFKFVRVDWIIYRDKLYFCELTFTPFSGFRKFKKDEYDFKFGSWIDI